MSIRVLIADDHVILLEGLRDLLGREKDLDVVAIARDADEAVKLAATLRPDVVVLDIDMPGRRSFEAASDLARLEPPARVIFLSGHCTDRYIESALQVDAAGFLTKDEPPSRVVEAIRAVASGRTYFSRRIESRLVLGAGKPRLRRGTPATRLATLTRREREVLAYLAQGMQKKEIAEKLGRSYSTVDGHALKIMQKLGIHDRVELARFAIREGLVEP